MEKTTREREEIARFYKAIAICKKTIYMNKFVRYYQFKKGFLEVLRQPWEYLLVITLLCIVIFPSMFIAGKNGFHFHDLSIPFDGGFRIYSGELPYRDFFFPSGLILFTQQAFFFKLMGVNLDSFLTHAATLNLIASFLTYLFFRGRCGKVLSLLIAVSTSMWFFLPMAAPYMDNTAFFWALIGLAALAIPDNQRSRWLILAGICASLSFLTKQNIGAFSIVGLSVLTLIKVGLRPRSFYFSLGLMLPLITLIVYLSLFAKIDEFVYYFWTIPLENDRLITLIPEILKIPNNLLLSNPSYSIDFTQFLLEFLSYGIFVALVIELRKVRTPGERFLIAMTIFLVLLQLFSSNSSNNDPKYYFPFIGWIIACLYLVYRRDSYSLHFATVLSILLIIVSVIGFSTSVSKTEIVDFKTTTENPFKQMGDMYISKHPSIAGLAVDQRIDQLIAYIEEQTEEIDHVFLYPDQTFVNGVTGRQSGQPILWFQSDLTFKKNGDIRTKGLILRAFEKDGIDWVVFERGGKEVFKEQFPDVVDYIDDNFVKVSLVAEYYTIFQRPR